MLLDSCTAELSSTAPFRLDSRMGHNAMYRSVKEDAGEGEAGMIKSLAVMTSGGDSPGMNTAVRAVVRRALDRGIQVCGIFYGYEGLVSGGDSIRPLHWEDVGGIIDKGNFPRNRPVGAIQDEAWKAAGRIQPAGTGNPGTGGHRRRRVAHGRPHPRRRMG